MYLLVHLFLFLVLPTAFLPYLVIGLFLPTPDLASPPPCGWDLGSWATPRTAGLIPMCLERPAFPRTTFFQSSFPSVPTVPIDSKEIILISPDGIFKCAKP